jgi:hypothetical protein
MLYDVRREMHDGFEAVRSEMRDGFAGVGGVPEEILEQQTDHQRRITALETAKKRS